MSQISIETRELIRAVIGDKPAMMSLAVAGCSPETLTANVAPGPETITVELIVRMQRLRWRRWDDFLLGFTAPTAEDLHGVYLRHRDRASVFQCGPGWCDLLAAGFDWLTETETGEWKSSQIKEKYGDLRWYFGGDISDHGEAIIEAAETISGCICDRCGDLGRLVVDRGWHMTRCDQHIGDRG